MPQSARSASSLVRFGVFELDLEVGELRKNGRKLKIEGQPLRVLQFLLERPGHVVTRGELQQKLWPTDTFVDFEQGINSAIRRLRQALDDSADTPRFIETLPRRGYRFIYPLNREPDQVRQHGLPARSRWIAAVALLSLAAVAGIVVRLNIAGVRQRDSGPAEMPSITSIAVLPLENLTGDAEQEYLVDAIHDELITSLAQISALKVISRTSVLRYKQQSKPLGEIARELKVESVLEGAVSREGERWHLTAQLVSASDDSHLWARSYDRGLRELAAVPSQVARAVANQLHVRLTPEEQARLAKVQPLDAALYKAYYKGRYYESKWTNENLEKAVGYYRDALDVDPTFARAWAGLGQAYLYLGGFARREGEEQVSSRDLRRRAEEALLRAVELDPTLRVPHQNLGAMRFEEWDWQGGAREYNRARELDPSPPGFPIYLLTTGQFDEAVETTRRDAELNPLDYSFQLLAGWTAFMAGRYDEGIVALKKTVDLDPNTDPPHFELAWCYVKKRMYKEAIAECGTSLALLRQKQPDAFAAQGCEWVYAVAGRRGEALEMAHRIERTSQDERFTRLAHVYDALGDRERALRYLQKAYEQKAASLPRQWYVPMLSDEIKADPRFQELIRRTGQPWAKFPTARTSFRDSTGR